MFFRQSRLYLAVVPFLALAPCAVGAPRGASEELERPAGILRDDSDPRRPVVEVVWNREGTDAGLKELFAWKELANVRVVNLNSSRITDAGLAHLERLDRLEGLYLNDTAITGAGLMRLKKLPHLKTLYVVGTKVTTGAVAEFKGARPDVTVLQRYATPPRFIGWWPRYIPRKYGGGFPPGR
ncbi:MAG: hypothetical protein U0793_25200 [Gemmataceae bacterium]